MAQSDLDRNLAATPYKLEKAKERGEVPKSPDVVAAAVFIAAVVFLAWQGLALIRDQFGFDRALLLQAGHLGSSPAALESLVPRMVRQSLMMAAPFLVTLFVVGILANVLQTGPVFSFEPVKPKWERLNPAEGFKRAFSLRTLFVAGRSLLKLALLSAVVFFALKSLLPVFFRLPDLSPGGQVRALLDACVSLGLKTALMLALIALVDLMYTRYEFAKKMRMSHREMKDEHKHREGDPRIRARLRQLRKEMLKRSRALRRTREADVLITNPTHVAVALKYDHGRMASPLLLAKGKGHMAAAMRAIAARHQIPVVQNPTLARTLYKELGIDHSVPPSLYTEVARIIVWVFARREAMKERRAVPAEQGSRKVGLWNS